MNSLLFEKLMARLDAARRYEAAAFKLNKKPQYSNFIARAEQLVQRCKLGATTDEDIELLLKGIDNE